jgi:pyruvyltransferase
VPAIPTRTNAGPTVFAWNPPKRRGRLSSRLLAHKRLNNFGDLLGPLIVGALLREHQLRPGRPSRRHRLLSVGSVIHLARPGDTVWGSGINGKMPLRAELLQSVDFRAVRGPMTRDALAHHGIECPAIYGDPGLLVPTLLPELCGAAPLRSKEPLIVPNFNDYPEFEHLPNVLDPCSPVEVCVSRIAHSRLVVGSSLHGLIVAEAFGVAARGIISVAEHEFKYADYYHGTGRPDFRLAANVEEAVDRGGESPPVWSPQALIDAFPIDLWTAQAGEGSQERRVSR